MGILLINGTLSANFKVATQIKAMIDDLPLYKLLVETETRLREMGLWDNTKPDGEALASTQPFALDTLSPEQWLQWIFIPRMRDMLERDQVPKGFAIYPYFEEVWRLDGDKARLLALLGEIDEECR